MSGPLWGSRDTMMNIRVPAWRCTAANEPRHTLLTVISCVWSMLLMSRGGALGSSGQVASSQRASSRGSLPGQWPNRNLSTRGEKPSRTGERSEHGHGCTHVHGRALTNFHQKYWPEVWMFWLTVKREPYICLWPPPIIMVKSIAS